MNSSFRLIRVRGIEIGANWSWLFMFGLIIYSLARAVFPAIEPGLSESTYWAMGAAAAVVFIVSLLLHELGHAFRAQKEGMEIDGITLWIFGGVAKFKGTFPSAGAEFRIAIAGPVVTFVLVGIFAGAHFVLGLAGAPAPLVGICEWLWEINLTLLVFNMIPALPLDGGRVLRSFLWQRSSDFVIATARAAKVSRLIAGIMITAGIFTLLTPSGSLEGLWIAFIGWFLLQASRTEESYALFQQTLEGLRVVDLMTPNPETVDPYMSVASFIEDVAHLRGHSTYPVMEGGIPVGMISLRRAAAVPAAERGMTRIRDIMVPREQVPVVEPNDDITHAAQALQAGGGRAVVMNDSGQLVGILSMADVARAVKHQQLRDGGAPPPVTGERRRRSPLAWILPVLAGVAALSFLYTPPFVILAPGAAFDVTPDIQIKGRPEDKVSGKFVLTSVAVQQPNLLGLGIALISGDQVLPLSAVVPPGGDSDEFFEEQEKLFEESEKIAAAAAAEAAGLEVKPRGDGALVSDLGKDTPASRVLEKGDVITAVNGKKVRFADEVVAAIRARPTGSRLVFEVTSDKRKRTVSLRSAANIVPGAPGIGAVLETHNFDVDLPFDITFRDREIGGPSAGLTYALAVYDLLSKGDLARGRNIATTGTIDAEGKVGPIGGIEEKAIAAKRQGADLFLVPQAEVNGARGVGLNVIGVSTLDEAIDALKN